MPQAQAEAALVEDATADFPAQLQLIAAMNLCPCGYLGYYNGKCRCTPDQISRYHSKVAGPLLDCVDIQIEVPTVAQDGVLKKVDGEAQRQFAGARGSCTTQCQPAHQDKANAQLSVAEIDVLCAPDA